MFALIPLLALSASAPPTSTAVTTCSITHILVGSDTADSRVCDSGCTLNACAFVTLKVVVSDHTRNVLPPDAFCSNVGPFKPELGQYQVDLHTWIFRYNVPLDCQQSCTWTFMIALTCDDNTTTPPKTYSNITVTHDGCGGLFSLNKAHNRSGNFSALNEACACASSCRPGFFRRWRRE